MNIRRLASTFEGDEISSEINETENKKETEMYSDPTRQARFPMTVTPPDGPEADGFAHRYPSGKLTAAQTWSMGQYSGNDAPRPAGRTPAANAAEALDRRLDQGLEETFPCSDPVSVMISPPG